MASPRRTRLIRKAAMPGLPTRVNEALRKGVAGLKQPHDLSDFLGEMLQSVAHIACAQTGWVVLLDTNATTCEFAAVKRHDGELVPGRTRMLVAARRNCSGH